MSRILFSTFMLVHGLIHLLGFAKQWEWAEISLLSGKTLLPVSEATTRLLGAGWFTAYVLFMLASYGCYRRQNWWMPTTLVALILSQSLIVFYWSDAWAGTLVNVFIVGVLATLYARDRFDRQIVAEIRMLFNPAGPRGQIVSTERLSGLPLPVQRWLRASGVVGKKEIQTVRLLQKGYMHTSPIGYHLPVEAEQFIRIDQPGFIWKAELQAFSFLPILGRDKYLAGRGHMWIKALSMISLVNAQGLKIDQGTLLRFLGEICWIPSAALSPYITWRAIDNRSAECTMTYEGVTASAVFRFDEYDRVVAVSANRYRGGDKNSQLTPWVVTCQAWGTHQGVKIPTQGYVTWKLPAQDFRYYEWEITDIEFDNPHSYQAGLSPAKESNVSNRQSAVVETH